MNQSVSRSDSDSTQLFVDANIFLSFYDFTSDDLAELDKLCMLIDDKKLNLLLPQQVVDETRRNRDQTVGRSLKQFWTLRPIEYPSYIKHHEKYEMMREHHKALAATHSKIVTDLRRRIDANELDADVMVSKLFDLATRIKTTPNIVACAKQRVALGNPPGKGQSIRDAVNWESLLNHVPSGATLAVVSQDGDYASALDKAKMNSFLRHEWTRVKATHEPYYYRTLSQFFATHHKDIRLVTEAAKERNELIDKLNHSGSFGMTHHLVALLSEHDHFTVGEAERLVGALQTNDQIAMIVGDPDVREFYERIRDNYGDNMAPEIRELLKWHLETAGLG